MSIGERSVQVVRFETFEADLQTRELRKNGHKVPLQGQPFQVLAILLQHRGKLVTREELRGKVWPEDTFVDFDHGLNTAITKIRTALEDEADNPSFVETMPRRGYRFIGAVIEPSSPAPLPVAPKARWVTWTAAMVAVIVVAGFAVSGWFSRKAHTLTDKDTIVVSDFTNTTGDTVFDGTLRQGLSVQLEQSPFLSIISDSKIQQTLGLMGKSAEAKLTPAIAREVCRRSGSAAVLDGSIAQIGTQYLLTLKAVNCASGESLASAEAQASDKNRILEALGKAAFGDAN